MQLNLRGKVALVSGGSAGMGRAIAKELAEEGAYVVIAARREDPLRATAREIEAAGGRVAYVSADMSKEEDVERAVTKTREAFGDPEIVIANVRSLIRYSFEETSADEFRQSCEQVILSVVHLAKATTPAMKLRRSGRFINIGSVCMKEPHRFYNIVLSNTFRVAQVGLLRTLSNELAPYGITVNNLAPGSISTGLNEAVHAGGAARQLPPVESEPRIPLGRPGTVEEVAGLCLYLCSERAGYITGQTIAVDGGWTRGLF
jgi:3-oxoacyl-[acyl-carrier protein] reductase